MRLTKRKALEVCYEWYMWWYENPSKSKDAWPKFIKGEYELDCPCCEYDGQFSDDCSYCPLIDFWQKHNNTPNVPCCSEEKDPGVSPFTLINNPGVEINIKKENILLIANAAKAELDKLPKLKRDRKKVNQPSQAGGK